MAIRSAVAIRSARPQVLIIPLAKQPQRSWCSCQRVLSRLLWLPTAAQVVSNSLPAAPVETGVIPHWLAVDGRQPAIPENAPLERPRAPKRPRSGAPSSAGVAAPPVAAGQGAGASGSGAGQGVGEGREDVSLVRAPLRHVASQELQLYYERVAALLSASSSGAAGAGGAAAAAGAEGQQARRALLASLAADPGLQPLAPHLVHLIAQEVANSLKSLPQLRLLLGWVGGWAHGPSPGHGDQ